MPVASLPGDYGIGTFGKEAYNFVDALSLAGQSYWQILPLDQQAKVIRRISHFQHLPVIRIL